MECFLLRRGESVCLKGLVCLLSVLEPLSHKKIDGCSTLSDQTTVGLKKELFIVQSVGFELFWSLCTRNVHCTLTVVFNAMPLFVCFRRFRKV